MKTLRKPNRLPRLVWVAGLLGGLLRTGLYRFGVDSRGLLAAKHPLALALWLVTAAALAAAVWSLRKQVGSARYRDTFGPSGLSGAGHMAAGICILLTAWLGSPLLTNYLGTIWKLLGVLSGPCLMAAGICRMKGKQPFFLLHMVPSLFLVFQMIDHYQLWSGNPQVQDYLFDLCGTMALALFSYYSAAFDVDAGNRRMYLLTGMASVYLCTVALSRTRFLFLYAGCILWVLSSLESILPAKAQPEPEEGEAP